MDTYLIRPPQAQKQVTGEARERPTQDAAPQALLSFVKLSRQTIKTFWILVKNGLEKSHQMIAFRTGEYADLTSPRGVDQCRPRGISCQKLIGALAHESDS